MTTPNDTLIAAREHFKTLSRPALLGAVAPKGPLQESLEAVFKAAAAEGVDQKLMMNAISKTSVTAGMLGLDVPEFQ